MNRLRALDEKGKTKAKRIGEQRAKDGVHFLCFLGFAFISVFE